MTILIKDAGFATSVQDLGRFGLSHLGISPAGAADSLSFRIANRLVGNADNAAELEMTLTGAAIEFQQAAVIAVTGAECGVEVNGHPAGCMRSLKLEAGSLVKVGPMTNGARAYLAVQGGIDVPLKMGSASTHLSAKFGGFEGRLLRRGDRLEVHNVGELRVCGLTSQPVPPVGWDGSAILRVTRGSQRDWFDADALASFFSGSFSISDQSGRTGLRLKGNSIFPRNTAQLLTDGVPLGAIQIPPDGQPIILFVDQQTTGGYPKIANVIAADMHLVGQLRARDSVRFAEISMEEAVKQLHQQEAWLEAIFSG